MGVGSSESWMADKKIEQKNVRKFGENLSEQ
jgi:hypothetical protein